MGARRFSSKYNKHDLRERIRSMREGYDVAQICPNGHVTNSSTINRPELNEMFCEKCGAETITNCSECNDPIRGWYLGAYGGDYTAPSFCIHCGHPFPWTESRIRAANELAQELDSLDAEDRAILQQSIDDLVKDTPSTTVAAVRFKRIMTKAGQGAAALFREILIEVLSETAKKTLWP